MSTDFNSGDNVVYPGHGVGTVVGTEAERIHDQATEFLVVRFPVGMILRIPFRNVTKSGLRKTSSRRAMQKVFGVLGGRPTTKKSKMWRHRAIEYAAQMKSGDPLAIAQIVRDLHRQPGQSEGSYSEKTIYEQAWNHLIGEVAAVDQTNIETAGKKVIALLEAA